MVLKANVHHNNRIIFGQQSRTVSEKTAPMYLLLVGLTVGHKAVRP